MTGKPELKICECCPSVFDGSDELASKDGWKVGWDGWICGKCDAPKPAPECVVRGAIARNVMCGYVIAGDHAKCGYEGDLICPHQLPQVKQ